MQNGHYQQCYQEETCADLDAATSGTKKDLRGLNEKSPTPSFHA